MTPLISVMIPCYNSSHTLPVALASLLEQTYTNWECIVVDDGSIDQPLNIISMLNDSRIKFHRFEENRGRGAARQHALNMSKGKYLCMIDADDWIYPWKLEKQVEIMEAYPQLGVLSTAMAIVDNHHNLQGIRLAYEKELNTFPPLRRPQYPPIPHAPSMIRTYIAREVGYDNSFRRTEDARFLLRILMQWSFGMLGTPLYAYAEQHSLNWRAILASQTNGIRLFSTYWSRFPLTTFWNISAILCKIFASGMINGLGQGRLYTHLRPTVPATSDYLKEFYNARQKVFDRLELP